MANQKVKLDELVNEFQSTYVERTGGKLNKEEAKAILEDVLFVYEGFFGEGLTVPFGKLGQFEVRERSARKGVNPTLLKELKAQGVSAEEAKQKAEIQIEASKAIAFKPSKGLKELAKGL